MSDTSLERELYATLKEADQRAPVVDDLALRAARPVRRRRAWIASGAAAVAVAAAGVAVTVSVPSDDNGGVASTPSTNPAVSTPVVSTPAVAAALVGTWRPTSIVGFDINNHSLGDLSPLQASQRAPVTFRSDKTWRGSDGCNGIGGSYNAKDDGAFTATARVQTLIGCDNVPNVRVLQDAARFKVEGSTLTFYNEQGARIATYVRM